MKVIMVIRVLRRAHKLIRFQGVRGNHANYWKRGAGF